MAHMEQTPGLLDDSCISSCGEVLWFRTVGVQGSGFRVQGLGFRFRV